METQTAIDRPSMNLTPRRGPSVWTRNEPSATLTRESLALVSAGACFLAGSLQRRGLGRAAAVALGLSCLAAGWVSDAWISGAVVWLDRVCHPYRHKQDARLDDALDDSFPASDAPSSMQIA
jgi:hypothetical protein